MDGIIKKDTGRTVHLADNDPFSAVDDESSIRCHKRHIAHIDVLFFDIPDRLGTCLFVHVPNNEPQGNFQRRPVGHTALLTFLNVIFWVFQLVAHELQLRPLREIPNREYRLENFLKP